ncbi:MAG: DsbA family protein [Hyphomicrobiales bacterium]|nr:DsbA family protein [Hyphomicrobiales bacterium]
MAGRKAPQGANKTIIALSAAVAAAAVGYAVFFNKDASIVGSGTQAVAAATVDLGALMEKGPLDENIMGKEDAPVTVIEYSSMTCGHCADFHKNVLPALKEKYIDTGKVRYILREFPLDDVATGAAMLARCVGPVRYFSFVDVMYERQKDWAFAQQPLPEMLKLAKQAGMTEERFNQCLSDQKLLDGINWVQARGETKFRVRATPTLFVNGVELRGVKSISQIDDVIQPLLKTN